MKEKIISVCTELKDVIDGIGAVQTAWGLIVACALIIAFVFCVFTFTNRVNKSTKAQVQRFQREGKYLPATYIELNDSTEYLRYFIFSYRWKHRIIRQYNHLFHGYEGKRLKKLLGPIAKYRLSYFTLISELNDTLSLMHDKLDSVRKESRELYEKYGQVVWAIANNTYNHVYAIEKMQDLLQLKNMVLMVL